MHASGAGTQRPTRNASSAIPSSEERAHATSADKMINFFMAPPSLAPEVILHFGRSLVPALHRMENRPGIDVGGARRTGHVRRRTHSAVPQVLDHLPIPLRVGEAGLVA